MGSASVAAPSSTLRALGVLSTCLAPDFGADQHTGVELDPVRDVARVHSDRRERVATRWLDAYRHAAVLDLVQQIGDRVEDLPAADGDDEKVGSDVVIAVYELLSWLQESLLRSMD